MKTLFTQTACLALTFGFLSASLTMAQEPPPQTAAEKIKDSLLVPGVSLAEGVSEITGVAISPLLGMSAVGAWTYYRTEESLRHRLPWYCNPYVWSTGMALIGICFLKDFLGAAAPALVKKPLDFVELFEDKLSALVASAGFVPLVAMAISHFQQAQPDQAFQGLADSGLATAPLASALDMTLQTPWLSVPVALVAFGVVWLSSHALNVLIAMSPFGIVDAGLKLTKLALLTLVTGAAALIPYSPYPALIVCGLLILIGLLIAGWSFRLTVFGTLMGRDFLLNKRAASADLETGVKGFLSRRMQGVPARTFGKLISDSTGGLRFAYRPCLILPQSQVAIPDAGMILCRGLLHPSVAHRPDDESRSRSAITLLPRYRNLEESIAQRFGCQAVVDSSLLRGLKAMRQWLVEVMSFGRNLVEAR